MSKWRTGDQVVFRTDRSGEVFTVLGTADTDNHVNLRSQGRFLTKIPSRLLEHKAQPVIAPGQTWRHSDSGRLVFVTVVTEHEILVVVQGQRSTSNTSAKHLREKFTLEFDPGDQ